MRILRANIENYRAIRQLELSCCDPFGKPQGITVLAGPNGSGKTSTLFAIVQALRGVLGYRTIDVPAPTNDDIRSPSGAGGWSEHPSEIHVDIHIQFDEEERVAIPELMRILGKDPPPVLTDGSLKVHWKFPPGVDERGGRLNWWSASIEPAKPRIRSWLEARKLAIRAWRHKQPGMKYDLLLRIGGLSFFPQDRYLRERVTGTSPAQSLERASSETRESEPEQELDRSRALEPAISEILRYFSDYAKNREPPLPDEQNWQKRVQDVFHRICGPKQYLGYMYREDDPEGSPVLQDGVHRYPLSQAASGEQVILEYITRLTWPTPAERNVVLIDEPEIHLHPAWIRQLYFALPRIGACNQYIVTTHSRELRERAAADGVLKDLGSLEQEK